MSELKVNTWKNGAGTRTYAPCTAWVNFDGTGTVSIRDQLNVSSITDLAVGEYQVNFQQAMANSNFAMTCCTNRTGDKNDCREIGRTTGSVSVENGAFQVGATNARDDVSVVSVIITGGV